ncbi:hypothetical protein FRC01_008073 [Tulasnella sp. 417]|nr:hypothetical protein FRC01_008073 [Tulasnella sp. 417]
MFAQLSSTALSESTATIALRPSLFGRVTCKLTKAFKRSRVEEEEVNVTAAPKHVSDDQEGSDFTETPSHSSSLTGDETPVAFTSSASSYLHEDQSMVTPPTAISSAPSSARHLQALSDLEAAKKKIAELEAAIAKRRIAHAAFVRQVDLTRSDMPRAVKKLTEEREIFRTRLGPAKREFARKVAENSGMERECNKQYERKLAAQLTVLGAKREIEESAKSKLFTTRTVDDSVTAPTARPNLFHQALRKLKKTLERSSEDEKATLYREEQNAQHGQTPGSEVQTSQACLCTQNIIVPSAPTEATNPNSSRSPSPPLNWTRGDSSRLSPPLHLTSSTPSPITTPALTTTPPTTVPSAPSPIRPCQAQTDLTAAKKKVAELEASNAQRKLEHANYARRVEEMDLPRRIKKLTEERDVFKVRLERAKQELIRKTAESSKMVGICGEEYERRLQAQLSVLGAKRAVEDRAQAYAELEAKFLDLQGRPESLHDGVDQGAPDNQESAAEDEGPLLARPVPSQWMKQSL